MSAPTCTECQKAGKTPARIDALGGTTTLLGWAPFYADGKYHAHDPNRTRSDYQCSEGHRWSEDSYRTCWCGWSGDPKREDAPAAPAPGPDLDPHWGILPTAEVLAVLPEGEAATVEQMLERLCPQPAEAPAGDSIQGLVLGMASESTAGKLRNALRTMVYAGILRQFPEGKALDAAAFWRAGDLAGQACAMAHALTQAAKDADALHERIAGLIPEARGAAEEIAQSAASPSLLRAIFELARARDTLTKALRGPEVHL